MLGDNQHHTSHSFFLSFPYALACAHCRSRFNPIPRPLVQHVNREPPFAHGLQPLLRVVQTLLQIHMWRELGYVHAFQLERQCCKERPLAYDRRVVDDGGRFVGCSDIRMVTGDGGENDGTFKASLECCQVRDDPGRLGWRSRLCRRTLLLER